ncbi:MAG: lysine--tRNA ligase, partial [Nanoarchaeota archaeon]
MNKKVKGVKEEKVKEALFWADQIASEVVNRARFRYIDRKVPAFSRYVVKTSASISGVLHIGRLSDTIRGESVTRALLDKGKKAELIWVAEDMDPLRKVPGGIPKSYVKYLGMPVTDIPDFEGCHKSYAEHNVSEYFKVLDKFVTVKMDKFSTREEYRKGNFNPYIKKLLNSLGELKQILNKYRTNLLPKDWSPWQPICESCGKIMTPRVLNFDSEYVEYVCKDYQFEKTTARGCGHKGENNPLKGEGKLVWKSEWAAEWARWQVSSEGAGKEYQVPSSAWWVNAEICERILDFPMPFPIFYEHIMIEGKKMSASLGNVIYPVQWLEVAPPELLRVFYNKRLAQTRSVSWKELPALYAEYEN